MRSVTVDMDFKPGVQYTFTVTAFNTDFRGDESEAETITFSSNKVFTEIVSDLRVTDVQENSVQLQWSPVKEPESKQIKICLVSGNQFARYPDVTVAASAGSVNLTRLSPNETFSFEVAVVNGTNVGPPNRVSASTPGKPLPRPEFTKANLTPESGTAIELEWKLPDEETEKQGWNYTVYYGLSLFDILAGNNTKSVFNATSVTIDHLVSCESYIFVVAIVGPRGFGPASRPLTNSSKYSPGAAPKNLAVKVNSANLTMDITWDASCPEIDDNISYLVGITTDSSEKIEVHKELAKAKKVHWRLAVDVHYGATYKVTVKTSAADAKVAGPAFCSGPPIPPPTGLTHHIVKENNHIKQLIYWKAPAELPHYLSSSTFFYRLFVSETSNMTGESVKSFKAKEPPFKLTDSIVSPGQLYFVAVALVDSDNYSSDLSGPIAVESAVPSDDIVISRRSAAGIVVPTIVVLVLMACGLAHHAYRNRRLKRSFSAFASRYSPSTGAAILNQGALDDDEDDDSPIIRGFSDDEPLVIS